MPAAYSPDSLLVPHFCGETLFCPQRGFFLEGKQQHSPVRALPILLVHPFKPLGWPCLWVGLPSAEEPWEPKSSVFSLLLHLE